MNECGHRHLDVIEAMPMYVGTEDAKARQRPEEGAIKKIARRFEDKKVEVSK